MNIAKIARRVLVGAIPLLKIASAEESRNSKSSYYFGLMMGRDSGETKGTITGFASGPAVDVSGSTSIPARGNSIGIYGGAEREIWPKIFLGGEMSAELYRLSNQLTLNFIDGNINSGTFSIKRPNSVSLSGRLGIKIHDRTLLYTKGGVLWSTYQLTSSVVASAGGLQGSAEGNVTKRFFPQPLLGMGIETDIAKTSNAVFIAGVEYQYIFGRKINVEMLSNSFVGNHRFNPTFDAFKVRIGVKY